MIANYKLKTIKILSKVIMYLVEISMKAKS